MRPGLNCSIPKLLNSYFWILGVRVWHWVFLIILSSEFEVIAWSNTYCIRAFGHGGSCRSLLQVPGRMKSMTRSNISVGRLNRPMMLFFRELLGNWQLNVDTSRVVGGGQIKSRGVLHQQGSALPQQWLTIVYLVWFLFPASCWIGYWEAILGIYWGSIGLIGEVGRFGPSQLRFFKRPKISRPKLGIC